MRFETNPLPGMNPWFEAYWGDIHTKLTTYSCDVMQRQLPVGLQARIEEYLSVFELENDSCIALLSAVLRDRPYIDFKSRCRRIIACH